MAGIVIHCGLVQFFTYFISSVHSFHLLICSFTHLLFKEKTKQKSLLKDIIKKFYNLYIKNKIKKKKKHLVLPLLLPNPLLLLPLILCLQIGTSSHHHHSLIQDIQHVLDAPVHCRCKSFQLILIVVPLRYYVLPYLLLHPPQIEIKGLSPVEAPVLGAGSTAER